MRLHNQVLFIKNRRQKETFGVERKPVRKMLTIYNAKRINKLFNKKTPVQYIIDSGVLFHIVSLYDSLTREYSLTYNASPSKWTIDMTSNT